MFLPITTKNVEEFLSEQKGPMSVGEFSCRFLMTEDRHYRKIKEVLDKLVAKGKATKTKQPSEAVKVFGSTLSQIFGLRTDTDYYAHITCHKESLK